MTDYCVYALEENLLMTQALGLELMREMNNEHQYIMECYETGILLEADTVTNKTEKISLWERIKNFFKKIFSVFTSKSKNLVASNEEFLTKNKNKLMTKDTTEMTLEVVNYKSQDFLIRKVNEVLGEINPLIQNYNKPVEELEQSLKEIIDKYSDEEGSTANGLKMLLRTGNPKGKLTYTTFTGAQMKPKITEYIEYCSSYTDQVNRANKCRTQAENIMKVTDQRLNEKEAQNKVNESVFLMLENCYNTDLVGLNILTEAESGDEVKPTGGSVTTSNAENKDNSNTDTNSGDNQDGEEKETKSMSAYRKFYNDLFNFMQVLISSALTIIEEKYHVFIGKLKQILNPEVTEEAKKEEEQKKEQEKGKETKKKKGLFSKFKKNKQK